MTRTLFLVVLAIAWLAAVGVGGRWLLDYQAAPGDPVEAPGDWPAGSAVRLEPDRFTLLWFAHPHCPCARASLDELSWLLSRAGGKVEAHLLFVVPPGAPSGWAETDLWRRAAALPGARVVVDEEAREARRFQAETSGQVLLYNPRGRLVFRGGITAGRGHRGANTGRHAVLCWLRSGSAGPTEAPVYGCPLREKESSCTQGQVEACVNPIPGR
jgi:hypothetical protein